MKMKLNFFDWGVMGRAPPNGSAKRRKQFNFIWFMSNKAKQKERSWRPPTATQLIPLIDCGGGERPGNKRRTKQPTAARQGKGNQQSNTPIAAGAGRPAIGWVALVDCASLLLFSFFNCWLMGGLLVFSLIKEKKTIPFNSSFLWSIKERNEELWN